MVYMRSHIHKVVYTGTIYTRVLEILGLFGVSRDDVVVHEKRMLRISEKYSVPVRASFADKVAGRSPASNGAMSEDEASGTKPVLRGGTFGT
jgi:hypothetical protein